MCVCVAFTCNVLVGFCLRHFLYKVLECLVQFIADNAGCVSVACEVSVANSL